MIVTSDPEVTAPKVPIPVEEAPVYGYWIVVAWPSSWRTTNSCIAESPTVETLTIDLTELSQFLLIVVTGIGVDVPVL